MNAPHTRPSRFAAGVAVATAGTFAAGLITAAPVHDISPVGHLAVQRVAFDLVVATSPVAVPGPSMSLTGSDLESEISAEPAYVPSLWLQQAYFSIGSTVGAAVGTALSLVDGLPAPLSDIGRAVLQFVASAVKTAFDALFFIDRQVQGIFGGLTNPQPARTVVHHQTLSLETPAPAAVVSPPPGGPARQSAPARISARAAVHPAGREAADIPVRRRSRGEAAVSGHQLGSALRAHPGTSRA